MAKKGIRRLEHDFRKMKIQHTIRRVKWIAACIGVVLLLSNFFSYSAYGINAFSAAYRLMNGGITIDFNQEDSEPYSGNPYEEEMKSICHTHDLEVLIPKYIPDGFNKARVYGDYYTLDDSSHLFFDFDRNKEHINLEIIRCEREKSGSAISLPSESYNVSQQKIGDTIIHVQKENHQYWAVFQIDMVQYVIYAEGLDYDECQRVLESMFK